MSANLLHYVDVYGLGLEIQQLLRDGAWARAAAREEDRR